MSRERLSTCTISSTLFSERKFHVVPTIACSARQIVHQASENCKATFTDIYAAFALAKSRFSVLRGYVESAVQQSFDSCTCEMLEAIALLFL
jgi:hypothetical protein